MTKSRPKRGTEQKGLNKEGASPKGSATPDLKKVSRLDLIHWRLASRSLSSQANVPFGLPSVYFSSCGRSLTITRSEPATNQILGISLFSSGFRLRGLTLTTQRERLPGICHGAHPSFHLTQPASLQILGMARSGCHNPPNKGIEPTKESLAAETDPNRDPLATWVVVSKVAICWLNPLIN